MSSCDCTIATDYIYKINFIECSNKIGILKISVILPTGYSGKMLFDIIESWVNTSSITLLTNTAVIEKVCEEQLQCVSANVPTSSNPERPTISIEQSAGGDTTLIAGSSGAVLSALTILCMISVLLVVLVKRKRNSNSIRYSCKHFYRQLY